jgi:hypothetical protein
VTSCACGSSAACRTTPAPGECACQTCPAGSPWSGSAAGLTVSSLKVSIRLPPCLTAEPDRQVFGRSTKAVKKSLKTHIAYLERELRTTDAELGMLIRQSPVWCEKEDLLRSVPGVGRVLALTLLAELPVPGRLTRRGGRQSRRRPSHRLRGALHRRTRGDQEPMQ